MHPTNIIQIVCHTVQLELFHFCAFVVTFLIYFFGGLCVVRYRLFNAVFKFKQTPFLFVRWLMVFAGCCALCRRELLTDNKNINPLLLFECCWSRLWVVCVVLCCTLYMPMHPFSILKSSNHLNKKNFEESLPFISIHVVFHRRLSFLNPKICVLPIRCFFRPARPQRSLKPPSWK